MSISDRTLIRACLAGDRGAWESLMLRYERLLYSIPLRCGLSEDDAADVAQTVCVRLVENLEKLRDEDHLTAWLILTARREAWRVYRARSRQVEFSNVGSAEQVGRLLDTLVAEEPEPQAESIRLEEAALIERAVQELGERCRRLIELLYRTDPVPSYDEIAVRMQMPRGAIGPTRARCMQKLRKILEQLGF